MLTELFIVAGVLLPVLEDPVFSGPQPGEPLVPFEITQTVGDDRGKSLDLIRLADEKPTVLVFVHEKTRPAFGLSNMIMRLVVSRPPETLTGGLIYLTDDPTETENWMGRVSHLFPKKAFVGLSKDGREGPGAYGLNRNVSVTILVGKAGKVTANFALVQPSIEVDGPKIFAAIADAIGEKEVPKVSDFLPQGGRRQAMQKQREGQKGISRPAGNQRSEQKPQRD